METQKFVVTTKWWLLMNRKVHLKAVHPSPSHLSSYGASGPDSCEQFRMIGPSIREDNTNIHTYRQTN